MPWDALGDELTRADVVVASTASPAHVVTRDMVKRAMKARKGRTLFFIDIAVPRNVEPTVHKIDNVYVYNVDDLEQEVAAGSRRGTAEVAAAEAIVERELREFLSVGARPRRARRRSSRSAPRPAPCSSPSSSGASAAGSSTSPRGTARRSRR